LVHDTVRKRRDTVRARRLVAQSGPASGEELLGISVKVWLFADVSAHLSIGIGSVLASGLLKLWWRNSPPLPYAWVRKTRRRAVMKQLKQILLGILMAVMVAGCAFAQKNNNDNRPPKGNEKIVEKPKEPKPPPSNSNDNTRKKP
jgi:hypothetical protein